MGANASTAVPLYASGQVLDAARLNLTNAGVPVFSGTATRDAAFGGSGEKVLAEGQLCYLEDANVVQYYDGVSFATVGPTTVTAPGLVLISTTTFAAASTATITNCFTATYRNYRIMLEGVTSVDSGIQGQLRVGGVTTTTNYERQRLQATSTTVSGTYASGLSAFLFVGSFTSRPNTAAIDIFSPAEAVATGYQSFGFYNDTNPILQLQAGKQTSATAFDSLVVSVTSGTFTGTVSLYGYSI